MKGEIYKVGDEVVHDVFGVGLIVDKIYNKYNKKPVIVVKFNSLETQRNIIADFHGIRKIKKGVKLNKIISKNYLTKNKNYCIL